ncbi:neutral zinc metallopeptidase [Tardibacter chloracetimidivorans]|uniref:Neutral zinc metallopeptidase n=1 Tax=Tardibacter chloracetimidivorans TaxID=1921510 RepID=A0A1L4A008_9SPHN|nr:metallopeptidase family protein [Tardibacter chloracetimidivorans]API61195.1 neutral zinc metallopeptidase [Tardibacter chloracetimidivorans]
MSSAAHLAPTLEEIETLARAAIGRLPDIFRSHLDGVVLRVEEFPDSEVIAEMGLESPFDILGLYSGRPVGDKSIDLSGSLPDMIHLYRRPILDEWAESGESLEALVTHVLVHEVGHHFGLSDEAMHAIEAQALD